MSQLGTVAPWDMVAEGYSEITMKYFGGFVESAIGLLDLRGDHDIVDIACGPGTLALAAADRVASVKALDFSQNMISILQGTLSDRGVTNVETFHGDGQNLPFADGSFDAAISMFGLMFFPNRDKGYGEIFRTLKPGGQMCVSSWAPVDDSPLMQVLFGALRAMNPDMPAPKTDMNSLENPEFFDAELTRAGFRNVTIHRVTHAIEVNSAKDFWDAMVRGSAPVLMMKNAMPPQAWAHKSAVAVEFIENSIGAFPASLSADAWLGTGIK